MLLLPRREVDVAARRVGQGVELGTDGVTAGDVPRLKAKGDRTPGRHRGVDWHEKE
jgi:hypothetical protein